MLSANTVVRHRSVALCRSMHVYTGALYIYIRKPSVCWVFTTDCPVKRLLQFQYSRKRLLPDEPSVRSLVDAMRGECAIVLCDVAYGLHYRSQHKSRSRYYTAIRQLSDNSRPCSRRSSWNKGKFLSQRTVPVQIWRPLVVTWGCLYLSVTSIMTWALRIPARVSLYICMSA